MSRNGSGIYSLPVNSWNPAINSVPATASDWQALINDVAQALTQSLSRDGQTVLTGNLQMGGNKLTGMSAGAASGESLRFEQLFSQGQPQDLASAATTDIGAQLTTVLNITGTTTITSFGSNYNGPRFLRFADALTLTHSASLVLPGGANITTAAGDGAIVVPLGTPAAGWRVVDYQLASNVPGTVSDGSVTAAKLAPEVLDALLVHGQCYLAKSGANLVLSPKNGNRLVINGASYAIPAAGISLAPTGTAADTNYNIFAYMNSGVMTLEYSTTGHSADATTGVEIKTGDATRTYVGKARTISAGAWVDDASHIYVLSWFNPKRKVGFASFTATRTVASGASAVEVNSEIRVFWLSHGIEPPDVLFTGGQFVTGAATGSSAVRLDGVTIGISLSICSSTGTTDMGINDNGFMPSEGDHYTTLFSSASGGTSISYIGGGNGAVTQQVIVNG